MSMHIFKYKSSIQNSSKGFTLIELMVSLSVFAIVMVVSTGTLLTFIDANAKAQAVYEATENLAFALDSMTREIRTGYHYYCYHTDANAREDDPLPAQTNPIFKICDITSDNSIAFFREKDTAHYGYRLNPVKKQIEQKIENGDWAPITADDVVVTEFKLKVSYAEPYYPAATDIRQPTVELSIKGYVNNGLDTDTDFNIQTRIVQRSLDIY